MTQDLLALRPADGFALIVADPPWRFETRSDKGRGRSADVHYGTMTLTDIEALPVGALAAKDCLLWLWATNPMLPQALGVMAAWGFAFRSAGHWSKRSSRGALAFGTGYWLRCAGEPFLLGVKGRPRPGSRSVRSVIEAPRREHSRKPEESFQAAGALAPEGPRLELFSRRRREGWTCWGDELDADEGAAA